MTHLLFHPAVQGEVRESFAWYESKAQGLGDDFLAELEQAYLAITELPLVWPVFRNNVRRYLLSRFPFAVLYQQVDERIYVVAVMHQRKKPDYWMQRSASNP